MLASYLQIFNPVHPSPFGLGALLLGFLNYYGNVFDFNFTGISLAQAGYVIGTIKTHNFILFSFFDFS